MLLANFCFFTLLRTNRPQELMKVAPSSRSKQILNELFQKIVQMHSKELNAHLGLNTCSTDKVRMEPANSQVIELCCNIFNVFICFSFLQQKGYKVSYKPKSRTCYLKIILFWSPMKIKKSISKLNIHSAYLLLKNKQWILKNQVLSKLKESTWQCLTSPDSYDLPVK